MQTYLHAKTLAEALPHAQTLVTLYLTDHEVEDFGEGFEQLIAVKMLVLRGRKLRRLPESVGKIPALESLYIEFCDEIRDIPATWFPFDNLINVCLRDMPRLERLPAGLSQCPKLQNIWVLHTAVAEFPPMPALELFQVEGNAMRHLPAWLLDSKNIRRLIIAHCPLQELPAALADWTQLEHLTLQHTEVADLPDLRACTQLKNLHIADTPLREIPDYLAQLPHLQTLITTKCAAPHPSRSSLLSDSILAISFSSSQSSEVWHNYRTGAFLVALRKTQIPKTSVLDLFDFYQNTKQEASIRLLLETLCLHYEKHQDQGIESHQRARAEIERRAVDALKINPLEKGKEIAVLGKKLLFGRSELKQKLENLGISYQAKIKKTTTHVVVGLNLNDKELDGCERADLVFLSDRQLEQVLQDLEDRFLTDAPVEDIQSQIQHLSGLLLSRDAANVELALQLLKTGGVPKELLTELFLVVKNPNLPDKTRKAARQLAELNGSEELRKRIADKNSFWTMNDDKLLLRRLQNCVAGTELDARKVAEYLLVDNRTAYRYWFSVISADERRATIEKELENPNYTPYLFDLWYDYTNQYGGSDGQDLVPLQPRLKRLSLAYAPQRSFCQKIYEFKNLEYLNIKQNVLKKLPKELTYFRQLVELDISGNYFDTFPEVLAQMPWLKTIHAAGNPFMTNGSPIPDGYVVEHNVLKRVR